MPVAKRLVAPKVVRMRDSDVATNEPIRTRLQLVLAAVSSS